MQRLSRAGPKPSPLEQCAAAALDGAGKEDAHPLQKAPCTLPAEGTAEVPDRTSLLPALAMMVNLNVVAIGSPGRLRNAKVTRTNGSKEAGPDDSFILVWEFVPARLSVRRADAAVLVFISEI
ncbi:unnamed protein product [Rangifer tarandus platyrhynchus]|uniref:Uncharacterized protein n=2 Tax=Rangifer tarandus platyrhynchus TaxID=3082113 RepID=A0AC59YWN8_RANTA|nr:unnamed protein product [Rangifer tarandus platyrhynchus]